MLTPKIATTLRGYDAPTFAADLFAGITTAKAIGTGVALGLLFRRLHGTGRPETLPPGD